jgi:uncharacterized protein (TIGR02147 family)
MSDVLRGDLAERRRINSRFSLRAYAKILSISPAHLSLILANKRAVTAKSAIKISAKLGLAPTETMALIQGSASEDDHDLRVLSKSEFSLISHWYYFAILGIANLKTNSSNPKWVAKRLGILLDVAKRALSELIEHGHIEIKGGQLRQCSEPLRTQDDVSDAAVRRYHKQNLNLAADRIDQIEPELREFATMTIPVDPKRIRSAKALLRKFREEFSSEISRGNKSEVYNLCIQFFPVTILPSKTLDSKKKVNS